MARSLDGGEGGAEGTHIAFAVHVLVKVREAQRALGCQNKVCYERLSGLLCGSAAVPHQGDSNRCPAIHKCPAAAVRAKRAEYLGYRVEHVEHRQWRGATDRARLKFRRQHPLHTNRRGRGAHADPCAANSASRRTASAGWIARRASSASEKSRR